MIAFGTALRAAPADRGAEVAGLVFHHLRDPMPTAAAESPPTTALAALAARAASEPEEPWLFYRRGWDWHWRSWGQVADQVARGAEALAGAEPAGGLRPLQDADAVAQALAVQASDPLTLTQQEIFQQARSFDEKLPPSTDRRILCATPALAGRDFQVVVAWTLWSGAAWVLEPDAGDFLDTVLWARPSVVMATGAELERLASAMAQRKYRRHSRLRVTVDVGKRPLTPVPSPTGPPRPPSTPSQREGCHLPPPHPPGENSTPDRETEDR